jgi:hypothetical protein
MSPDSAIAPRVFRWSPSEPNQGRPALTLFQSATRIILRQRLEALRMAWLARANSGRWARRVTQTTCLTPAARSARIVRSTSP